MARQLNMKSVFFLLTLFLFPSSLIVDCAISGKGLRVNEGLVSITTSFTPYYIYLTNDWNDEATVSLEQQQQGGGGGDTPPPPSPFDVWIESGEVKKLLPQQQLVIGVKVNREFNTSPTGCFTGGVVFKRDGNIALQVGLIAAGGGGGGNTLSGPQELWLGNILPTGEFSQGVMEVLALSTRAPMRGGEGGVQRITDIVTFGTPGFRIQISPPRGDSAGGGVGLPLYGPIALEDLQGGLGLERNPSTPVVLPVSSLDEQVLAKNVPSAEFRFNGETLGLAYACLGIWGEGLSSPLCVCAKAVVVDHVNIHPVIDVQRVVVDYDGDGIEMVKLDGKRSHTHEQSSEVRRSLVVWRWKVDGVSISDGAETTLSTPVGLGEHMAYMEVQDDDTPPKTLADAVPFVIARPTTIPGPQIFIYGNILAPTSIFAKPSNTLPPPTWISSSAAAFSIPVEPVNKYLAGSTISVNCVARLMGTVYFDKRIAPDNTIIITTEGAPAYILIDGQNVEADVKTNIEFGPKILEVRFAVKAKARNLALRINGKVLPTFHAGDRSIVISRDETSIPPFINSITPSIGRQDLATTITITGVGFVMPGHQASEVKVLYRDQYLTPLSVTARSITLEIPPAYFVGHFDIRVITPRGESNLRQFESAE